MIACASTFIGTCTISGGAGRCAADDSVVPEGVSTREARQQATRGVPFDRLNPNLSGEVREVLEKPSYFRRMPSQQISCDPQMFTFLVRRPEVMVNIWEVMGITKVKAKRTSPSSFMADDGVGTACKCDLIFSDNNLHIYFGNGVYEGSMSPRKVTGRCVCLLRTENQTTNPDAPNISGTMDVFLKVDNFGADLLTRTIGPFVGKTADYNFVETSKFISQISNICQTNPSAAQALVMRLDRVDDATRREFAEIVTQLASQRADQDSRQFVDAYQRQAALPREPQASELTLENQQLVSAPGVATHLNLSDSQVMLLPPRQSQSPRSQPAQQTLESLLPAPAAIAPHKANIYMRR